MPSGYADQALMAATMQTIPRRSAAIIAKATGRPLRLQQMRHDATGWDPKAPAGVHSVRPPFDSGRQVLLALRISGQGFSTADVSPNGSSPPDLLVGQVLGASNAKRKYEFNVPADYN